MHQMMISTLMSQMKLWQLTACLLKLWEHVIPKQGKTVLQEAFECLYEHNRPVYTKLQAEPENILDKSAIAVYLLSLSDYENLGYIASDLTQYLHPWLKHPPLEVSVTNIRFCTTFLTMLQ